jgi:hypothetical protein
MSISVLRWIAQLSALLITGAFVFLVVGEFRQSNSHPSALVEWTGLALLTATCIGMLIAWRWELPGAVLSLGSRVA